MSPSLLLLKMIYPEPFLYPSSATTLDEITCLLPRFLQKLPSSSQCFSPSVPTVCFQYSSQRGLIKVVKSCHPLPKTFQALAFLFKVKATVASWSVFPNPQLPPIHFLPPTTLHSALFTLTSLQFRSPRHTSILGSLSWGCYLYLNVLTPDTCWLLYYLQVFIQILPY